MAEEHESSSGLARELIALFGIGVDTKELKKGESALNEFLEHTKDIAEKLAGLFAVDALFEWAESQVHAITTIEHASAKLGLTTEQIQLYQFAAADASISSDELLKAMGHLELQIGQAGQGSEKAAKALGSLGVSVHDTHGKIKGADELFEEIADKISKTEEPSKQAALAVAAFGKQGQMLLPLLKQGKEGVQGLRKEFQELGGGYSERAIEASKSLDAVITRNALSIRSLAGVVFEQFAPALQWVLEIFGTMANWFRRLIDNTAAVEAALYVLGAAAAVFAVRFALANLPLIGMTLAVIALIAVIDDLLVLFKGGESVAGRFLDAIFGKGASLKIVQELRDVWHELSLDLHNSWEWIKGIADEMAKIVGLGEKGAIKKLLGIKDTPEESTATDEQGNKFEHKRGVGIFIEPGKKPRAVSGATNEDRERGYQSSPGESASAEPESHELAPTKGAGLGGGKLARNQVRTSESYEVKADVKVNVDAKHLDSKQVVEAIAKHSAAALKRELRAAKVYQQRVNPSGSSE